MDTDMATTIIDWTENEMNRINELIKSLTDSGCDNFDAYLRFMTPDGTRFRIGGWLYSQDDKGHHELVCVLVPEDAQKT